MFASVLGLGTSCVPVNGVNVLTAALPLAVIVNALLLWSTIAGELQVSRLVLVMAKSWVGVVIVAPE